MSYNETSKQHEQTRRIEYLFNDLIERYAPNPETGNYLGAEYRAYEPDCRISEVRFVAVETTDEQPMQYITIGKLYGERTIIPYTITRVEATAEDAQQSLRMRVGEELLPEDPQFINDMLQELTNLAEADALREVDESEDSLFNNQFAPDFA